MKPYKDMTPTERTIARIAQNRAIDAATAPVIAAQQKQASARHTRTIYKALKGLVRGLVREGDSETAIGILRIMKGERPPFK